MRLQLSPEGMCNDDGSINQSFFKPKKIIIQLTEDKKWGATERDALYKVRPTTSVHLLRSRNPIRTILSPRSIQGLEKHGVGKWREMINEFPELKRYDEQFIRIKASRLLGTQSLARHVGWKGDRAAVDAEREAHRQLGERLGCWKAGVLVEDDHGSVAKALAEIEANKITS